ncbi:MAG: hypothetical protein J6U87_01830 [Clostridia bacterium]|nr:hypothetical protein [Clostridia bacterium]
MSEKIKDFIEGSVGYLAAALVAIAYVATGLLVPGINDKSPIDVVREGAVSFALGVAINFCLNLQGILKGKRSTKLEKTVEAHGEAVEAIEPQIHRLDGWCNDQNAMVLRRERTRILNAAALRYEDCFDEQGVPLSPDFSGLPEEVREEREAAMKAATKLRITPISAASLTGESGRPDDPFYFGETVDEYQRRTNIKDAISKLVIAAAFGYFSVDMVMNFDVAQLIWRLLYVTLLLALGVAKLLRSYLFVVDTYRGNIVKRINYLQVFKNWAEKTPESEERK